jgi:hypothetical protein
VSRPGRLFALVLATAALVTVLGCGEDRGPLALYRGAWNGDNALIVGRVEREGDCLYIAQDPSTKVPRMLLAFADNGVTWDEEEQAVQVAGKSVPVGAVLTAGGSEASSVASINWSTPPAPGCNTLRIWLLGPPHQYRVGGPLPVEPTPSN